MPPTAVSNALDVRGARLASKTILHSPACVCHAPHALCGLCGAPAGGHKSDFLQIAPSVCAVCFR